jgi:hypothetical protein
MKQPDRSDLACLLAAVETLLRDKVTTATHGEARFAALMAASAIGMARRGVVLDPAVRNTAADVAALAPQPSPFPSGTVALTHLLREGFMDGQEEVFRRLFVDAITRTAITRPQVLSDSERRLADLDDGAVS